MSCYRYGDVLLAPVPSFHKTGEGISFFIAAWEMKNTNKSTLQNKTKKKYVGKIIKKYENKMYPVQ